MQEQEGVIKYQLIHTDAVYPFTQQQLVPINCWRNIMLKLGLIGQDDDRYGGLGYGNISQRMDYGSTEFIITGTQTGELPHLEPSHFCIVSEADLHNNRITSKGPCKPSSEALTHAAVYHQDLHIQSVIHAHNSDIWKNSHRLGLPYTSSDTPYGTPEMALAVKQLFDAGKFDNVSIFTMQGHEDGVMAFGANMEQVALELIKYLAKAIEIERL